MCSAQYGCLIVVPWFRASRYIAQVLPDDSEMLQIAPVTTGIIINFTFNMSWICIIIIIIIIAIIIVITTSYCRAFCPWTRFRTCSWCYVCNTEKNDILKHIIINLDVNVSIVFLMNSFTGDSGLLHSIYTELLLYKHEVKYEIYIHKLMSYTEWFKKMDSNSYVYISWTIHGMWMIHITFEKGGPKFSNTTARALA